MMKAVLVPIHFPTGMDDEFRRHLEIVKELLAEEAELLPPVPLGSRLPPAADAAVFPQLLGGAFRQLADLKAVTLPALVLTSDFGTVNMWDWEIVTFMKSLGMKVFTPYDVDHTRKICRALALRREMREVRFLVYQDNPGEGMQAEIFKRFWWWEEASGALIREKYGIRIVKKSFKTLGAEAKAVSDADARAALKGREVPAEGLAEKPLLAAVKLYLAVKRDLDADPAIRAAGINCLNESFHSDTTPCLAWDLLYRERGLIWACEADTLSMLTLYLLNRSLDSPIMMSNLYPFLMGGAALKHEKIDRFPDVPEPENHLLMVHCGYFGVVPQEFCTSWTLRPKVLAIVDDNASMIDGRLATGPMTLAKLHPELKSIQVIKGELEDYVQYPGSDCRNGALLKVADGPALMKAFYSHHYALLTGKRATEIEHVARVMDLGVEAL